MCIADPSDWKLVLFLFLLPIRERASLDWVLTPFSGSCHFGAPVSFCSLDHSGYVRLFTLPRETRVSPWPVSLVPPPPEPWSRSRWDQPGEVWPCLFPVSLPEGAASRSRSSGGTAHTLSGGASRGSRCDFTFSFAEILKLRF